MCTKAHTHTHTYFTHTQHTHTHTHTHTHREFKERAVKGGDKLDLGGGHELEFVMAPNLHW